MLGRDLGGVNETLQEIRDDLVSALTLECRRGPSGKVETYRVSILIRLGPRVRDTKDEYQDGKL